LLNILAASTSDSAGATFTDVLSLMFPGPPLLPWLTAFRNVELALELRGVKRSERRDHARELLGRVICRDSRSRLPTAFRGMKQRVALARALARTTDVLLMDEPFGASTRSRATASTRSSSASGRDRADDPLVTHNARAKRWRSATASWFHSGPAA